MTKFFHKQHIGGNLIECHVSRTLNHNLNIFLPSTLCQFTKHDKFLNLRGICRIVYTARTASITKTNCYIVFCKYIENFITVSYTHLRAHETDSYLVCRLLLE